MNINNGSAGVNTSSAIGTGTLTITGGTIDATVASIVLGTNNAISIGSSFTFTGTNSLNMGAGAVALTTTPTITVSNNILTLGGNIGQSGTQGLTKAGNGTLTLGGVNTFTGGTTVSAGILQLGNAGALGDGTNNTSGVTVANGAALDLAGFTPTASAVPLSIVGQFSSSVGALTNSSSTAATYGGVVTIATGGDSIGGVGNITLTSRIGANANSLTKVGSDTLTLSAASSRTGIVAINVGVMQVGADGAMGTSAASVSVISGAALDLNGITYNTASSLTLNGAGISSGGALLTSSSTAAAYAGLINLGSNSTIMAGSGNITISNAGTITGSGDNLTIDGAKNGTITSIIGTVAGSLTKSGNGTWTLNGVNTYTGSTTITLGTLQIGSAGSLGSGTYAGAINNSGTLEYSSSAAQILSGIISGGGVLTKDTSSSTLTLTATNTYSGGTTINANSGLLIANTNNGTNITGIGSGAVSIGSGSTLTLTSVNTVAAATTISNTFSAGGSTGLLKLNFTDTFATATNTTINNATAFTGTIELANTTASNRDKLDVTGQTFAAALLQIDSGSTLLPLSGTTTFTNGISVIGTGNAENFGAIRLIGNLAGGNVSLAGSTSIGAEGGALSNNIVSGAAGTQTLTIQNGAATFNATLSGNIGGGTGTIALTQTATGTLILSGNNTYTGATTISNGILQLGSAGALGDGTNNTSGVTVASGAALDLAGFTPTASAVPLSIVGQFSPTVGALTNSSSTAATYGGVVTIAAGGDSIGGVGNITLISGIGANANSLAKVGSDTLTLSAASRSNRQLVVAINVGVMQVGADGAMGTSTASVSVTSGAALDLNGVTYNTASSLTLNGAGISSGGALFNSSSTAAIYAGLIKLGSNSTIMDGSGNITISNAGTITGSGFTLTVDGAKTGTITSNIGTGAGGLVKSGSGTWTLNGADTYTGATQISAGKLQLGNIGALGSGGNNTSSVTVSNLATLDLNGITPSASAVPLSLTGQFGSTVGALTNSNSTAATYGGVVTLGTGGASIGSNSGNITLSSGIATNANALTKVGSNTLTLPMVSIPTPATPPLLWAHCKSARTAR